MTDALVILAKARTQCRQHRARFLGPRFREDDGEERERLSALTAMPA
jgi:hypothetical protein